MSQISAFTTALHAFQVGLSDEEIEIFRLTTIEHVWDMIRYLQAEQASRMSMQNMSRLEPFINALTRYSGVIEVFVQGKPEIMAFIWGPFKMLLQIASTYADHFDKLLDAFKSIGDCLPRFATYEKIFQYDPRLKEVIAMVYQDIMEFFRRTWKFFRRRAWHILLDCLWSDFEGRFKVILGNLKRHKELLDREAITSEMQQASSARKAQEQKLDGLTDMLSKEIQDADTSRKRIELEYSESEKTRTEQQRIAVVHWIDGIDCEDEKEKTIMYRHLNTGRWLFERIEFKNWFNGSSGVLWLAGKPGCGKSVLASTVIDELTLNRRKQVLKYFCDYKDNQKSTLCSLLRSISSQYLSQNPDLFPVAYQWLVKSIQKRASLSSTKKHFRELLQLYTEPIYLIIDGLDECEQKEQLEIQTYITDTIKNYGSFLRVCIASRELKLERRFQNLGIVKVNIGKESNYSDINSYVTSELQRVKTILEPDFCLSESYICQTMKILADRADGMFLWVRLVIEGLLRVTTFQEFDIAVGDLPDGLEQAYGRILQSIECSPKDARQRQILRILKLLVCAPRVVKVSEVESWLVIDPGSRKMLERPSIRDCGQLLEIMPDSTIQFVHFSVKEYILSSSSGGLHVSPFISPIAAHLNAFKACVTYLSFDHIMADKEEAIFSHLVNGDYRLLSYCNKYWIHHLEECCKLTPDIPIIEEITALLVPFLKVRCNRNNRGDLSTLVMKKGHSGDEFACLNRVDGFETDALKLLLRVKQYDQQLYDQFKLGLPLDDLHQWHQHNHPLEVTQQVWKVQGILENHMIMQGPLSTTPEAQALARLYGSKIYLCRHPACEENISPKEFRTSAERDTHEETVHSRPFECPHQSCMYYIAGFSTKRDLSRHLKKYHFRASESTSVDYDALNEIVLPEFFNDAKVAMAKENGTSQGSYSGTDNYAQIHDYQMQLLLVEHRNKKRLLIARQKANNVINTK